MTTYYKVVNEDGSTPQGYGKWPLPVKEADGTWTPGEWVSVKRPIKRALTTDDLCTRRVLHVVRADQLLDWLGPVIAEVETDGEVVEGPDKCGTRRARLVRIVETWNERAARLFAVECAESVLHLIDDPVSRETCEITLYVARCHADGEATDMELAAARAAAGDAAWAAAGPAAWAAAGAAAGDAAWAAAGPAAWAAAGPAAWDAARDAHRRRLAVALGLAS